MLAPMVAELSAETLWVYGVYEDSEGVHGWYDADKNGNNDSALCWAAVSSNLINWWQDQYVTPDGVPTGEAVWSTYRSSANNTMANTQIGVEWWLTGDGYSLYELFYGVSFFKNTTNGGYYTRYENDPDAIYYDGKYVYHVEDNSARNLAATIYTALNTEEGRIGIGVNVGSSPSSTYHGITLWGAEFADDLTLTALYLTDSDDATVNAAGDLDLFKVNVRYENYNGTEYLYLEDYWNSGARYVESLTLFDATQTDAWGMERQSFVMPALIVPEPATATLSIMALAALALRRRRS